MPIAPVGPRAAPNAKAQSAQPRPADGPPEPAADRFITQLPVTLNHAALNRDGSVIQVGPYAGPTATLSLPEIAQADREQRRELLARLERYLVFLAGGAAGGKQPAPLPDGERRAGGFGLQVKGERLRLWREGGACWVLQGGQRVAAQSTVEGSSARRLALEALGALLRTPLGQVDPWCAQVALALFAPGAPLSSHEGGYGEKLVSPKLIAWDFNGTVQDDLGLARPGMKASVEALNRLGGVNVLTTSIDPEEPERFLQEQGLAFTASFGREQVRPTKREKLYQGVAQTFGLHGASARAQMVVVGDSPTDLPGDWAGGLFINDRAMVPAPALELLLVELDLRGKGSVEDGVRALLGGAKLTEEPLRLQLGPLRFRLFMRTVAAAQGPRQVPVVSGLEIDLGPKELAGLLGKAQPHPTAQEDRLTRLAVAHLGATLPEEQVARVAAHLARGADASKVQEALEERLLRRGVEVALAEELAQGLPAQLSSPISFEAAARLLLQLAAAGTKAGAAVVREEVTRFGERTDQAQRQALDQLQAFADEVRTVGPAGPAPPSGPEVRQAGRLIAGLTGKPVPADPKAHERILAALQRLADLGDPAADQRVARFMAALPQGLEGARARLVDMMDERRELQAELEELAQWAHQRALQRERTFAEIAQAAGRLGMRAASGQ
jgi:hypothetical protein